MEDMELRESASQVVNSSFPAKTLKSNESISMSSSSTSTMVSTPVPARHRDGLTKFDENRYIEKLKEAERTIAHLQRENIRQRQEVITVNKSA